MQCTSSVALLDIMRLSTSQIADEVSLRRSSRQIKKVFEGHTYTEGGEDSDDESYPKTGRRGSPQVFPRKLYEMLEQVDPRVMAWNACGNGFHIFDMDSFTTQVLLDYFRHQKYSSFQRQLNLYGFRKVCKGPDVGAYVHDSFQRSAPALLSSVRRVPQSHKHYRSARFGARRPARAHGGSMSAPGPKLGNSGRAAACARPNVEHEEEKGDADFGEEDDFEELIDGNEETAAPTVALGAHEALGGSVGDARSVVRSQPGAALAVPVVEKLAQGLGSLALGQAALGPAAAPAAAPARLKLGHLVASLRLKIPAAPAWLPELGAEASGNAGVTTGGGARDTCPPTDDEPDSGMLQDPEPLTPGVTPGGLEGAAAATAGAADRAFFLEYPGDQQDGARTRAVLAPSVSELLAPLESPCKLGRLTSENWQVDYAAAANFTFDAAVFAASGEMAPPRLLHMER
jgi:hypothetical protein